MTKTMGINPFTGEKSENGINPFTGEYIINLKVGMAVEVTHINGTEFGGVESINTKTGKILVAFGTGSSLNFALFHISNVKAVA